MLVLEYPLSFQLGSFHLYAHTLFELLAFFIGFRYYLHLRKNKADIISDQGRLWIIIGATFGALLGSRLIGALEDPDLFFSGKAGWLYYYQSKTIVGGLLGGLWGVELAKKIIGERHSSGDLFTFPLMLGMIIGRIGCFSMGIYEPTYGLASSLPWALDLGDGITRHPTALYEIVFLVTCWVALLALERRVNLVSGARFKVFMVSYLLYRFLVEFIRPGIVVGWGMTTLQWTCLIGLIYYWRVWLWPGSMVESSSKSLSI
ncbi:MAG: hypothetical protein DHS20C18_36470 [Saprospiraceae bacterium]|nr:MAG: hypothetical protein DHS20C18_36470 [Saprospiraceae bacterium]